MPSASGLPGGGVGCAGEPLDPARGDLHRLAVVLARRVDDTMAKGEAERLDRGGMHRAADRVDPAGIFVFQRIALAPVLATQVEDQADEEQDEGPEDEQGDVDAGGELRGHGLAFQIGWALRPKRAGTVGGAAGRALTSGPRATIVPISSAISRP